MRLGILTTLLLFSVSTYAQPKGDEILPKYIPQSPNAAMPDKKAVTYVCENFWRLN